MDDVSYEGNLDKFLNAKQFADVLGVQREQVYQWLRKGKVKGMRLSEKGKSPWRIPYIEVIRFRERCYAKDED